MLEVLTRICATAGVSPELAIRPPATVTRHVVNFAPFVAILVFAIALPVLIARLLGQSNPGKGKASASSGAASTGRLNEPAARGDLHKDEREQRSPPPPR
ncbi:hypothetical protein N183_32610 [Sinorhizobium sp. Sb3]|nr:hypothetical protein N183_32610 [Sinorhizobium sp. Sb3]